MCPAPTDPADRSDRPEPRIRPATAADHDSWHPLWLGYQRFYETRIDEAVTRESWARILDPGAPMHAALAEVDDGDGPRLVGFVHYLMHPSFWTRGDYCYLQDLFVAPTVRGLGIGRRLIDHVYERAGSAGCSRVWWLTHETNTDAMKLYDQVADRSGFIQYRKLL